ncbi:unnamed protein product, partial [Ectocarpus fasciculatus]
PSRRQRGRLCNGSGRCHEAPAVGGARWRLPTGQTHGPEHHLRPRGRHRERAEDRAGVRPEDRGRRHQERCDGQKAGKSEGERGFRGRAGPHLRGVRHLRRRLHRHQ